MNGCDSVEKVTLNKTTLSGNANGGAIFAGPVRALILESKFLSNMSAGIFFADAQTTKNLIFSTLITGTKVNPNPPSGVDPVGLADGVLVLKSATVTILASSILNNQRAGVIVSGGTSEAKTGVTNVNFNRFGVVWNDNATYVDLGGCDISANTVQNFLTDGDLPVPSEPMDVPCIDDATCASGVCVGGVCAE